MQDPFADNVATRKYVWDANGILVPAVDRFPSAANGAGFKPLADWVHAQGLKFGIHIVRGIPRQVVNENLPIAGSGFHAQDAADTAAVCPWDEGNYGVSDTPAGQAYYDSMMKLYAGWGLDFIKVDCISDHPYRPTEIRQIAEAIRKTHRPIVLSLSPGPTQLDHAAEVGQIRADVAHHRRPLGRVERRAQTRRRRVSLWHEGENRGSVLVEQNGFIGNEELEFAH